jgi:hypothetical protein
VLSRIAGHPINRIDELLPWNLAETLSKAHATLPNRYGLRQHSLRMAYNAPIRDAYEIMTGQALDCDDERETARLNENQNSHSVCRSVGVWILLTCVSESFAIIRFSRLKPSDVRPFLSIVFAAVIEAGLSWSLVLEASTPKKAIFSGGGLGLGLPIVGASR